MNLFLIYLKVVEVIHPGLANVSKKDLRASLAKTYKIADENLVVLFGFRTLFGGGRSTGFCLIYDNTKALLEYEPKYRLARQGLYKKPETARKMRKERKNRAKKYRGVERAKVLSGAGASK